MPNHKAVKICEDFIDTPSDLKIQKEVFYTGFCHVASSPFLNPSGVHIITFMFGHLLVSEDGYPYFYQSTVGILPKQIRPQLKEMLEPKWSFISDEVFRQIVWGAGKDPGGFYKLVSELIGSSDPKPDEVAQLQQDIYEGLQTVLSQRNPIRRLSVNELEEEKREKLANKKIRSLFRVEKDYMASYYQMNNAHWFRSMPNGDVVVFSIFGSYTPIRSCRLRPYK